MLGVNVSCEAGVLDAQGPVLAVTDQQRERITDSLKDNKLSCSAASRVLQVHGGTHTHTHTHTHRE